MPVDADIAATVDVLSLEKIKAQDYRDHIRRVDAREEERLASQKSSANVYAGLASGVPPPKAELRADIVKAIAANYMKPSTATLPESIASDAKLKALRLAAAVVEVEAIVNAGTP